VDDFGKSSAKRRGPSIENARKNEKGDGEGGGGSKPKEWREASSQWKILGEKEVNISLLKGEKADYQ